MNQAEIAVHEKIKKKIPHYPALPRFITHKDSKKYNGFDKGLKESCIRGFRKRLSNWLKDDNNAKAYFVHAPDHMVVKDKEEVPQES